MMPFEWMSLPTTEQVDSAGKKGRFNKTESKANAHESRVRLDSDSSDTNTRPDNSHEAKVETGPYLCDQHVTGELAKDCKVSVLSQNNNYAQSLP